MASTREIARTDEGRPRLGRRRGEHRGGLRSRVRTLRGARRYLGKQARVPAGRDGEVLQKRESA